MTREGMRFSVDTILSKNNITIYEDTGGDPFGRPVTRSNTRLEMIFRNMEKYENGSDPA